LEEKRKPDYKHIYVLKLVKTPIEREKSIFEDFKI
jgi:hypothetical protein